MSVTFLERGSAKTVAFTGELTIDLGERQYERGYGPCLASVEGGEPIVINDMDSEQRWRDWAVQAAAAGAGSSLSIPVPLQREVMAALNIYSTDVMAALNIYSTDRNALTTTAWSWARPFSAYAGVAVANMHLYQAQEQMAQQRQHAMHSRAVIEQAKGVLMGQRRCTSQEAFDILITLSQQSNRKLRVIAQSLVDHATGSSSDG